MPPDDTWHRYWRYLTARFRPEVDDEIDFHLTMRAQELERQGMSPDAARREAQTRFGDRDHVRATLHRIERHRGRQMTLRFWLAELWSDIQYGLRGLLKRPGYTAMTASSLALGIAATTVALSVIDAYLLRPLPVQHADRLVVVGAMNRATGAMPGNILALPTIRDLSEHKDLFEEVAGVTILAASIRPEGADRGERVMLQSATGNFFSVLGLTAFRGRAFDSDDDRSRARVIVLSHRAWRTRFRSDPAIVGRRLYLNTVPFEVIGVTPETFHGTDHLFDIEGFLPAGALGAIEGNPGGGGEERRDHGRYSAIARRQPHQSVAAIRAALGTTAKRLETTYPELGVDFQLPAFDEKQARPALAAANGMTIAGIVFGLLALSVLLTAAVNATNLILARASTRQTELAVRQALGASRGRLMMQMLTETALLATLALAGGWLLAKVGIGALGNIPLKFGGMSLRWGITLDGRVFAMTVVVSLLTGLLAGVGPAITASGFALQARLRDGGRSGTSRRGQRIRSGLIVAQVAASMIVLVSAGLFVTSAKQAERVDLGVRADEVLSMSFDASLAHYDSTAARAAQTRIAAAVAAVPGVRSVAWSTAVPIKKGASLFVEVTSDGVGQTARSSGITMLGAAVSYGYFATLGIPLVEGRTFTEADDSSRTNLVVLNRKAAETLWPGQPAVGKLVRTSGGGPAAEVVGVVGDGKYFLIGEATRPFVYYLSAQRYEPAFYLSVRTASAPEAMIPTVEAAIAAADPDLTPFDVSPLDVTLATSPNGLLALRVVAGFGMSLGFLAIVLTLVGLYGVISYSVAQRTSEIGLRMALGASGAVVVRSIMADGGRLAAIGIGLGLVGAVGVIRAVSGMLVGPRDTDWVIAAATALGLGLAALVSAYLPARRAAKINPIRAIG